MKVALVYDRVNKWGGAERLLLALNEVFPEAPLYTAVFNSQKAKWAKVFPKVTSSFLQNVPILKNHHELLGFLTPIAFESFELDKFDLVISVTSEAAKGIITKPATRHVCICLTPTRYLWSGYNEYLNSPSSKLSWIPFYKLVSQPFLRYAKYWDEIASKRPDEYIAISNAVKERIKKYYNRDSKVIFPPVDLEKFAAKNALPIETEGEYYLFFSRLIPYKKADLAIKAFNRLGIKLLVIGKGSEYKKLKRIAKNNIRFLGHLPDDDLVRYYKYAKALIFPGEEDFGIVMAESLAAGTPVIAYGRGGSIDIVKNGKTGVLFKDQTVEGVINAVKRFEKMKFNKKTLVESVSKFSKERFKKQILALAIPSL